MHRANAILIAGVRFHPDPSGALYWPERETLVVADLHLEKGSAYAWRGIFLPPYDSRATLTALERACARYAPRALVALGDSFHDGEAADRLSAPDRLRLARLCARHAFTWIRGNHDGALSPALGGTVSDDLRIGPIAFRHAPSARPEGPEIAGHLHPCVSLVLRGRRLRGRAFVSDGVRAVLPAFGAYAGGLDVSAPAFRGLFRRAPHLWVIGRTRVYALGANGYADAVRRSALAMAPAASASTMASMP